MMTMSAGDKLGLSDKEKEVFEEAQDDWSNVQEIVPKFKKKRIGSSCCSDDPDEENGGGGYGQVPSGQSPFVTIDQIIDDFRCQDLSQQLAQVESDMAQLSRVTGMRSLVRNMVACFRMRAAASSLVGVGSGGSGNWQQAKRLEEEKHLIFAIAKCPLDNANPLHYQVLLTIFKKLTGDTVDRPRYGQHWEQIGFQGSDPATDLRGIGFLGLIQVVYFVMTPEWLPLAREIYKLSQNPAQEFPLMVLSINVTRIALYILRDELLCRLITQEDSVWSPFNLLYVALMNHIFHVWKSEHKTIKDSGYVLKDAEKYGRKNARNMISQIKCQMQCQKLF